MPLNKVKKSVIEKQSIEDIAGSDISITELQDTPSSFSGKKGKSLIINPNENGVNFSDSSFSGLFQNAIINGNFDIWQRGTSFTSIGDAEYHTDRFYFFRYAVTTSSVNDIVRDTDVPSGIGSVYSLRVDCTTAETPLGAASATAVAYKMEGYDFRHFVGKTATLSFWVKSNRAGTYPQTFSVSFLNNGLDRSYIAEYQINAQNTWEKKEITLTFDYSGGTWDYENNTGIGISWTLSASPAVSTGTLNTWLPAPLVSSTNQVNMADDTSNKFWLAQVQMNIGESVLPFASQTYGEELKRCQRYFESIKTYNSLASFANGIGYTTTSAFFTLFFKEKRIEPTIAFKPTYSDFEVLESGSFSKKAVSGNSGDQMTHNSMRILLDCASGVAIGSPTLLQAKDLTSYIEIDAEL